MRPLSSQVQIAVIIVALALGVLIGRFLTPHPPPSAEERDRIVGTAQGAIVQTVLDARAHYNQATEDALVNQLNSEFKR